MKKFKKVLKFKKLFLCFTSFLSVFLIAVPFTASASTEFNSFTLEEAALWSCENNGTLKTKVHSQPTRISNKDGYAKIDFDKDPTSPSGYLNGYYAAVFGLNLKPQQSTYSLSFEVFFNSPVYVSYAAMTMSDGRSVMADAEPLTHDDFPKVNVSGKNGVVGYRFTFPSQSYTGYLSLNLVCDLTDWMSYTEFYMVSTFNYEYSMFSNDYGGVDSSHSQSQNDLDQAEEELFSSTEENPDR